MKFTKIKINTKTQKYPIIIGSNLISKLNIIIKENSIQFNKCFLIIDKNIPKKQIDKIKRSLKNKETIIYFIDANEKNKNQRIADKILDKLLFKDFSREDCLISVGGGITGDLGGFVASLFKRGMQFINLPTTLLAQVDASVGGKLGIDFNTYKNQIGIFKIPNLIIVDTKFLSSLSERELRSGYAEVIKHCLINDATKFKEITKINWKDNNWEEIVRHSILIKSEVVENDLTEEGLRKILNFGHTIGHAIETTYLEKKNKFLHGEAIAIGMICESYISFHKKMFSENELNTISDYILSVFKSNKIEYNEEILENAKQDKKNFNKKIMISLLEEVGKCNFDFEVSEDEIKKSIEYYNKLIS